MLVRAIFGKILIINRSYCKSNTKPEMKFYYALLLN